MKSDEKIRIMKKFENNKIRKESGILNREAGIKYFDISIHGKKMQQVFDLV